MNAIHTSTNQSNELNAMIEKFILDSIRYVRPEWVDKDGGCEKCNAYYASLNDIGIIE